MCHAPLPFEAVLQLKGIAGPYKGKVIQMKEAFPCLFGAEYFVAMCPPGHKGKVGFAGKFEVLEAKLFENGVEIELEMAA